MSRSYDANAGMGSVRAIASSRWRRAALLCLWAAGALPLLAGRPAPLQDWPNHLARMHILSGLLRGDAFWTHLYRPTGFWVPNAALDLCVLGLLRAGLTVAVAGQVFLLAAYGVFVGGFCALARAQGASGPEKIGFAILLFYGNALFWGLVDYVLGAGLMLGLLALWLGAELHPVRRLGIAAAGAAVLLFTHVVDAAAWVAVLGCFDLRRFVVRRDVVGSASWLAALAVAAGLLMALPGGQDFALRYAGDAFLARKLGLFGKVLLGGSLLQDAASVAALLVCIAAACCSGPRIGAGAALAVAGLVLVTVAAPERLGTGSLLDARLAILPLLLLAAATRLRPGRVAAWAIAGAVLARTLLVAAQFHAAGLVFRDFRRESAGLPAGAVMMMAYGTPLATLSWQRIWSPPIQSIATQVVFRDVFMPAIFANPAQQPMALRAAYVALKQPWDLTDAAHLSATAAALAPVCAARQFAGVYLTVLYPGAFIAGHAGAGLLSADPEFLILDACRLPR